MPRSICSNMEAILQYSAMQRNSLRLQRISSRDMPSADDAVIHLTTLKGGSYLTGLLYMKTSPTECIGHGPTVSPSDRYSIARSWW